MVNIVCVAVYIHFNQVDWRTAESICDACELRLAQIESLEEDQEIIYEIQKNGKWLNLC